MNRLIIGTVTARLSPTDARTIPDDRQELVKTISYSGGAFVPSVVVVDGGYTTNGEITSYSGVKIAAADWSTILGYHTARTAVSVTGLDGVAVSGCRVKLLNWSNNKNFATYTADLEIWRL